MAFACPRLFYCLFFSAARHAICRRELLLGVIIVIFVFVRKLVEDDLDRLLAQSVVALEDVERIGNPSVDRSFHRLRRGRIRFEEPTAMCVMRDRRQPSPGQQLASFMANRRLERAPAVAFPAAPEQA